MDGDAPLVLRAVTVGDLGRAIRRAIDGCHRGEVALLGLGGELKAGAEEAARERVVDDLAHSVSVGAGDRRGLGVVPKLEPILLDEVAVPRRFLDDTACG